MSNLQITARYQIPGDNLAAFKKIAEECHSIVKAKDKDTLQFDWYFNESQTECVLRETYPDSNALLSHLENVGELFSKLLGLAEFSAEVYGQPSPELLQATNGLSIKIFPFYQGL